MWTCDFYRYEHIYTYRRNEAFSKHSSKKIMQLNMELNMILIMLMEFAYVRHSEHCRKMSNVGGDAAQCPVFLSEIKR